MSPVVKRKAERVTFSGRTLLLILTVLCVFLMVLTVGTDILNRPVNTVVGYVVVPFQKGIEKAGSWFSNRSDELSNIRSLIEENNQLRDEVARLTEQNTLLQQDKYELNNLRNILQLSEQYSEYQKTGARIIAKDSGNWYHSFLVDKGEEDGLSLDMNCIAGGGLVGRITEIGPNWARVTAIINDNQNVSGMILSTEDNLIVSGNLKLAAENLISFEKLVDSKNLVKVGDKVVTSNISDKYLPGILIGYVSSVEGDGNNLTKSGLLVPAVDFEHLNEVLVITDKKESLRD